MLSDNSILTHLNTQGKWIEVAYVYQTHLKRFTSEDFDMKLKVQFPQLYILSNFCKTQNPFLSKQAQGHLQ